MKNAAYIIFLSFCIWFALHPSYIKGFGETLILPQIEEPKNKDFDVKNPFFCIFTFYGILLGPLFILDRWDKRK